MAWKSQRDRGALLAELEQAKARAMAASSPSAPASTNSPVPLAPSLPAPAAASVSKPPLDRTAPADDPATRTELLRLLDEKNARLLAADSSLAEARRRIGELEARLETVEKESEQLASSQKNLQEQLQTATRLTESLQSQIRSREERLAQTEVSNQDLRKRSEDSSKRLGALSELIAQVDDLTRRRETYMNNVLRRYREATELFRTLSLRLEAANTVSNELSRIQQAIYAADEDIRQINSLNAQSVKLQRDLAAARR